MISWEYIMKRRGWTVPQVVRSLDDPTWDSFCAFFENKGIECPPKSEFDDAVKIKKPAPVKKPAAAKKKTATKRRPSTRKTRKPKA